MTVCLPSVPIFCRLLFRALFVYKVERVTTVYSVTEDRILLSAEVMCGGSHKLWLTLRLLQRLVPVLLRTCNAGEQGHSISMAEQVFKQEKAKGELTRQPSVRVDEHSPEFLVNEVSFSAAEGITLIFKSPGADQHALYLAATPLRQWLGILCQHYESAGWPMAVWPQWIREQGPASGVALH